MHRARSAMPMVAKGGENKYDHYTYATLADYIEAIQKSLDDNGLIVVSHIDEINWLDNRVTQQGKAEKVCRIMLRTTVIHAESGEQMAVTVLGEGQDRGDKAFYKADTGARKYALANLFNLATDDDPETDSPEGQRQNGSSKQQERPASGGHQERHAAQTFTPPPGWPDTPAAELVKWVNALTTIAGVKTAIGIFVGEHALTQDIAEWEPIVAAVAGRYKALTSHNGEPFKRYRDSELEQSITKQLEYIETAKQGEQAFSPPAGDTPAATA